MTTNILSLEALERALSLRDLTDPRQGPHAMQTLLTGIVDALCAPWGCRAQVYRLHPVVSLEDNYDRLHYPADGAARDARYTRYVAPDRVLRTQTTAMIPSALRGLEPPSEGVLVVCPGLVYRRDSIDRIHTGEPHQVDLWYVTPSGLSGRALDTMVERTMRAALPDRSTRSECRRHPYTEDGRQLDAYDPHLGWVEVGECGIARPEMLREAGLHEHAGLAMGLGLDRLLMLRKQIPDIRLLRSEEPRVQAQMLDLTPYAPVSDQPAIVRDLSIVTASDRTPEELGDLARTALGPDAAKIEDVAVRAETNWNQLPDHARARLGITEGQKNVLLRITLRDLVRSLSSAEANQLRNRIYDAVHEGPVREHAPQRGPT